MTDICFKIIWIVGGGRNEARVVMSRSLLKVQDGYMVFIVLPSPITCIFKIFQD